jgi:hypothetical protein
MNKITELVQSEHNILRAILRMWDYFLWFQSDSNTVFLRCYAYVKILIKERPDQFVISSRNVQGHAFVLVSALAVQVTFL